MHQLAYVTGVPAQWAWLIWAVSMVVLATRQRRRLRRAKAGHNPHLTEMAVSGICFAMSFIPLELSVTSAGTWKAVVVASAGGSLWGLYAGRKLARARRAELDRQAPEGGQAREIAWRLPKRNRLREILIMASLIALMVAVERVTRWRAWVFGALLPTALGLFIGFFLAASVYTWCWASRKERNLSTPILVCFTQRGE